jgi:beta-xylosidase
MKPILILLLLRASTGFAAEPGVINAATNFPPDVIAAVKATGSGISGPGKPVEGDGVVPGLVSGKAITAENRDHLASGKTVKEGILPHIKPVWDVHMRDTIIILGGDGNYYLTGSSGDNIWKYNDGIELWKSPDMIHWSYLGLVWTIEKDGGWEKKWRDHRGPTRAIWAPEIHYIHHNYYLTFGMPPGGMSILKSTTGKPEGPYVHATDPEKPLVGGIGPTKDSFLIDPTLFEDDDGKVYFTYGPAKVIARLKDDLSGFAETPREVHLADRTEDPSTRRDVGNDIGFEGATLFKENGEYYLGSTDKVHGHYSMCLAVSDNIYGPYRMRHESVPGAGGTGFFKAKDGYWYTSFFGDDPSAPWREKPGIVRVDFDKDGKVFVAKEQPDFILLKDTKSP